MGNGDFGDGIVLSFDGGWRRRRLGWHVCSAAGTWLVRLLWI
jgi:hypothetical protein